MKISTSNMSAPRVLTFGLVFLYHIRFSNADDVGLSLFYHEGLFQSNSALDLTQPDDLISDVNFNGEANPDLLSILDDSDSSDLVSILAGDSGFSDLFSVLPDDSGSSDLLFSNEPDTISFDDSTFLADCGFIDSGALRKSKKARFRRDTACPNPDSPKLSLPTLDQMNQGPRRPQTEEEKKNADIFNVFSGDFVGLGRLTFYHLAECGSDEKKICDSGVSHDTQVESIGKYYTTYTVADATMSKRFSFAHDLNHVNVALALSICPLPKQNYCCKNYDLASQRATACRQKLY